MDEQVRSNGKLQTIKEEIFNSITHGLGVLLSIFALIFLVFQAVRYGTTRHVVSSAIFGSALIFMYLNSTLYHAIYHETTKKIFRRLDHISIYLLIAGTYMPIALLVLKGPFGWTMFGLEWGLCLIGVIFKAVFGPKLSILSAIFYLFMGWAAVIAIKPLLQALSLQGIVFLFLGGLFYTLGIIFFALDKKVPYFHTIWHVFVLLGSFSHFLLVLLYVLPYFN
ncbi:MAG: hemolysin III family protein [Parachlamydiales bacterium]|nr:hemolysin III family protein [Parachlamydiales bacterium]